MSVTYVTDVRFIRPTRALPVFVPARRDRAQNVGLTAGERARSAVSGYGRDHERRLRTTNIAPPARQLSPNKIGKPALPPVCGSWPVIAPGWVVDGLPCSPSVVVACSGVVVVGTM